MELNICIKVADLDAALALLIELRATAKLSGAGTVSFSTYQGCAETVGGAAIATSSPE